MSHQTDPIQLIQRATRKQAWSVAQLTVHTCQTPLIGTYIVAPSGVRVGVGQKLDTTSLTSKCMLRLYLSLFPRGARSLNFLPVHKLKDVFGSHLIHGGARLCGLWWKKSITKPFTEEVVSVPELDISAKHARSAALLHHPSSAA
jgi:hypothetical protein